MAKGSREATTVGETFADRLVVLRKAVGYSSQARLARRLTDLGYPMHETTLTRIERKTRKVTLDDAVAIAAALDVPLMALLVPDDGAAPVKLAGSALIQSADDVGKWMAGEGPLAAKNEQMYEAHVPAWQRKTRVEITELTAETKQLAEEASQAFAIAKATASFSEKLAARLEALEERKPK